MDPMAGFRAFHWLGLPPWLPLLGMPPLGVAPARHGAGLFEMKAKLMLPLSVISPCSGYCIKRIGHGNFFPIFKFAAVGEEAYLEEGLPSVLL